MAKLIGPLFSQQAKGKISGAITYFERDGVAQVTGITKPKKEKTAAQEAVRIYFGDGIEGYKDLPPEERQEWEERARDYNKDKPGWKHLSGQCYYMMNWMNLY